MRFGTQIQVALLGHLLPRDLDEEDFVGERNFLLVHAKYSIRYFSFLFFFYFLFLSLLSFTFLVFGFGVCSSHGCIVVFSSPPLLVPPP